MGNNDVFMDCSWLIFGLLYGKIHESYINGGDDGNFICK